MRSNRLPRTLRARLGVACPPTRPKHRAAVPVDSPGPYVLFVQVGFDRPFVAHRGLTYDSARITAINYARRGARAWAEEAK